MTRAMLPIMRNLLIPVLLLGVSAHAQWAIQDSHTTADLRGVHSLGKGVAWAGGTKGTVLRTVDGGSNWRVCAVPPGAEKLDFRAIQGLGKDTAVAMSAGAGDLSRVYKTSDGCRTWKLVFSNPDKTGFWDGLQFATPKFGVLIGDPVNGKLQMFISTDAGETWKRREDGGLVVRAQKESMFAASNTSLAVLDNGKRFLLLTGGSVSSVYSGVPMGAYEAAPVPLSTGDSAGGFSIAAKGLTVISVGGDYKKPEERAGTAAILVGATWRLSKQQPSGYRSAVAWFPEANAWIASGPSGTDLSRDNGDTWTPLKPTGRDAAAADRNWNALSPPFAVGPNGRIGKFSGPVANPAGL